jgi:hypothetical protein
MSQDIFSIYLSIYIYKYIAQWKLLVDELDSYTLTIIKNLVRKYVGIFFC